MKTKFVELKTLLSWFLSVSGQEQNYQVQYVDSELYHSNSSQTQM